SSSTRRRSEPRPGAASIRPPRASRHSATGSRTSSAGATRARRQAPSNRFATVASLDFERTSCEDRCSAVVRSNLEGEGVLSRSGRKLVALLAAVATVGASLALVTIGRAGSGGDGQMSVFVTPPNITSGKTGVAWAKFTPTPAGSNGSATHVHIAITVPGAADGTVHLTSCPGGIPKDGFTVDQQTFQLVADAHSATCLISSIQSNVQKKVFAT